MAQRDDPDKVFGPSQRGTVFGILYGTVRWTWGLPQDKLTRLSTQIQALLYSESTRQDEIQSIVGRIIHVRPLVPQGRFYMNHLLALNNASGRT